MAGILQGVIGFFEPDSKAVSPAHFYKLQGVVAVSGILSGSVNFAVIQATVLVQAYADVRLVYECYQPMQLGMDVGVSVELSVKVLFVHVHFSFHAHISMSETIGHASPTPWIVAQPSQSPPNLQEQTPVLMAMAEQASPIQVGAALAGGTTPSIQWSTAATAYFSSVAALDLLFIPTPLVVDPATSGGGSANLVAMLYMENGVSNTSPESVPFNLLLQSVLAWALKSGALPTLNSLTQTNAGTLTVSFNQLGDLYTAILDAPAPSYSDTTLFLSQNFSSLQIKAYDGQSSNEIHGSVFPMIPDLDLVCGSNTVPFATQMPVDDTYVNHINTYLQYLNALPPQSKTVSFSGNGSMATMVFNDYFQLLLRAVVQNAQNLLRLYPTKIAATPSVTDQLTSLGVDCTSADTSSFASFAQANQPCRLLQEQVSPCWHRNWWFRAKVLRASNKSLLL